MRIDGDDTEAILTFLLDFYHLDYLTPKKSLSRRSSQRSTRSSSPQNSRLVRRLAPRKLNLALLDDPLLAQASATNGSMPLTPPAEEPAFQNLDVSTKLPDTPIADQFEDDDLESEQSDTEHEVESAHLITHAKVYAIAEKYVCSFVTFAFTRFA